MGLPPGSENEDEARELSRILPRKYEHITKTKMFVSLRFLVGMGGGYVEVDDTNKVVKILNRKY